MNRPNAAYYPLRSNSKEMAVGGGKMEKNGQTFNIFNVRESVVKEEDY